jgi:cytochrome P450
VGSPPIAALSRVRALLGCYHHDPPTPLAACTQEAIRLDPSVTSATTVVQDTFTVPGKIGEVRKGLCEQYVIGTANRDPATFKKPNMFNPMRDDLFKSLTFNGCGFAPDEVNYPRICPGRYLARTVIRQIIDLIVKAAPIPA